MKYGLMAALVCMVATASASCFDAGLTIRHWPVHEDVWKLNVPDQGYLILQLPDSSQIDWQEQDSDQTNLIQALRDEQASAVLHQMNISVDPAQLRIYRIVRPGRLHLHFMPYREMDKTVVLDDPRPLDLMLDITPMPKVDQAKNVQVPPMIEHKKHWWSSKPKPAAVKAQDVKKSCDGKD